MKKKLKVNDTLSIGRKMVLFPVALLVFGLMGTAFYFIAQKQAPGAMLFMGCLASFVFGWICWRLMVMWWKAWAFRHVKNEYQLRKRTAQEQLLWPAVGYFTQAKSRLVQRDNLILPEPGKLPEETTLYFSKSKNLAQMEPKLLVAGVCVFILVYLWLFRSEGVPAEGFKIAFIAFVAGFLALVEYLEAINSHPQIRISDRGIWTKNAGFEPWEKITYAEVNTMPDKHNSNFLVYGYSDGSESIQIDDFNVEPWQLESILLEYRERHKTTFHQV